MPDVLASEAQGFHEGPNGFEVLWFAGDKDRAAGWYWQPNNGHGGGMMGPFETSEEARLDYYDR